MATNQLTDAQRVILAAAGARDSNLVLPIPPSLGINRGTLGIVVKSLLTRGLIVERMAQTGEEVWRETEEGARTTLLVSDEGLRLIGIEPAGGTDEPELQLPGQSDAAFGSATSLPQEAGTAADPSTPPVPKAGSKLDALISTLRRAEGASIADMVSATGWRAHSIRGAISGNLKKKLKLEVTSEVIEGRGRVYRIAEAVSA